MAWLQKLCNVMFDLRKDGKLLFRGSEQECFIKLHQLQSASVDHAIKYEGYTISPTLEDWKDHYNWYVDISGKARIVPRKPRKDDMSDFKDTPTEPKKPLRTAKPGESLIPGGPRERPSIYQSTQTTGRGKITQTAVNWRQIIPAETLNGSKLILDAWQKTKDKNTRFVSWDNLAKETGLEVGTIASHLKWIFQQHPDAIGFSVDRMGAGTYVKIKNPAIFI